MLTEQPQTDATGFPWQAMMPAWLFSLAVHLLLAIAGSLIVRGLPLRSAPIESIRSGEIVLARRQPQQSEYFSDDASLQAQRVLKPVTTAAGAAAAPATDVPPLLNGIALPKRADGPSIQLGALDAPRFTGPQGRPSLPANPADEAAILAEDALIPRENPLTGPTAPLSLFGSAISPGRSFVFVIDRSNSMGADGLGAIEAVARELAAQLDSLSSEQTFQVVAYNQAVAYFTRQELVSASPENKNQLVRFIANLAAFGQTEHSRGLLAALRLRPEVIFLLTDGGEPVLNPGQLRLIRDQAAGRTTIHCIQFGRGPQNNSAHFLARLAAENRGAYVYIDVNAR